MAHASQSTGLSPMTEITIFFCRLFFCMIPDNLTKVFVIGFALDPIECAKNPTPTQNRKKSSTGRK